MASESYARWPQLDTLFAALLELDPAEQPAYLERIGADDAELRTELEGLLHARDASADFLENPALLLRPLAQATIAAARAGPAVGERVGAYRLVGEIGRGGMGVVYLAERADGGFEQRAALKLLAGWLTTPEAVRRFQRERQILARLEHPHIARLLDGGVTAENRPYFVMEHVAGTPIDRYCDERRLDIRRRLELFLQVCGAVAFAHRNLVVHRDIKPGNVLVTGEGTAKLLDFGIARLLQEDGEDLGLTRTASHPMTPSHASPEMLAGEPVGTASDVYQLGILLYQLLTGRPPHRPRGPSLAELERLVLTTEPEKPSTGVAHVGEPGTSPDEVARVRATTPDRLRRRLHGDLDTIALAALRREPERRYASVEQLAEDVRRHLEGQPVRARGDTILYRSSRFLRRHRFGLATAIAALVVLVGFAGAMAREARRTARERDRAEQVTRFLVDLFQRSEPGAAPGDTLTVRRVLQQGAERVRTELRRQPEMRARLLAVIGGVYRKLGLYQEARPLLEEAVAIERRVLPADDPELGNSVAELGLLFMDQRQPAAAEPLFREALRLARMRRGAPDSAVAGELNDYAYSLHVQGKFAAAESLYRSALTLYRRSPTLNPNYPVALSNLGWILLGRGDFAAADSALRAALALRRQMHAPGDRRVANGLAALAYLRNQEERFPEAAPLASEALRIRRSVYGDAHPAVADALATLAASAAGQHHFAEADSLYRMSLAILARAVGEDSRDAAQVLARLASVLADMGRTADGEAMARRAYAIYQRRVGAGHPSTVSAGTNLAGILVQAGHLDEAGPLYHEGLRSVRATWPGDHPQTARLLAALGRYDLARGDTAAALPHLREGVTMLRRTLPHGEETIARAQVSLGEALIAQRDYAEAEPLLRDAQWALARGVSAADPDARRARAALVRLQAER